MKTFELTANQKDLFDAVVYNKNNTIDGGIFVLRGYAGTGKTVTLSKLVTDVDFENILIATPTVSAMAVLKGKIPSINNSKKRITYSTLSKLVQKPAERIKVLNQYYVLEENDMDKLQDMLTHLKIWDDGIIVKRLTYPKPTAMNPNPEPITKFIIDEELLEKTMSSKFKNASQMLGKVEPFFTFLDNIDITEKLKDYDLILVDEMSMVSQDTISPIIEAQKYLMNYVENNGSKYGKYIPTIVLAGDKGQLPPVEGGLNVYFKEDNIEDIPADKVVNLDTILRSTDTIANMAKLIRDGKPLQAIASASPTGDVYKKDLEDYIAEHSDLLKTVDVAITYTNKDVFLLNREIRRLKGFGGKLAHEGETLMVLENSVPNDYNVVPFANGEEQYVVKKIFI